MPIVVVSGRLTIQYDNTGVMVEELKGIPLCLRLAYPAKTDF